MPDEPSTRRLTAVHEAILTVFQALPQGVRVDAVRLAWFLDMPEGEAAQALDELEAAGFLISAIAPIR